MVGSIHARHSFFELENGLETQLRCCGGGRSHVVGLDCSGDEYRIGTPRERRTEVEFQLPDLVAAESEPDEIVALDEQLDAELVGEPREMFDRCWSRLQ